MRDNALLRSKMLAHLKSARLLADELNQKETRYFIGLAVDMVRDSSVRIVASSSAHEETSERVRRRS